MKKTMKSLLAIGTALSLMLVSIDMAAKERDGARVLIIKKEGREVKGEPLRVTDDSLVVMGHNGGVTVKAGDIEQVGVFRRKKKGSADKIICGILLGGLAGSGLGALIAPQEKPTGGWFDMTGLGNTFPRFYWGVGGFIIGGIAGGTISAISESQSKKRIEKKFIFSAIHQPTLTQVLAKLDQLAREPSGTGAKIIP